MLASTLESQRAFYEESLNDIEEKVKEELDQKKHRL